MLHRPRRFHEPRTALAVATILAAATLAGSCSPTPDAVPREPSGTALIAIYNARIPMDGVLSGGQPSREQLETAARGGYRTVINLRTDGESGFEWEREAAEVLGMSYVQIPIAGADGLTRENVEQIDAALGDGLARGPVLFHCGSGNRIGAVLALRQVWLYDARPEEALELGRAAGMTRLEGKVGEILGLEEAP